jgi:hypothetical protein
MLTELASLRAELRVYKEELARLREPKPDPKPNAETFRPIDSEKAQKFKELLGGGTPWQKYRREAQKRLREQPKEVVVETPATQ